MNQTLPRYDESETAEAFARLPARDAADFIILTHLGLIAGIAANVLGWFGRDCEARGNDRGGADLFSAGILETVEQVWTGLPDLDGPIAAHIARKAANAMHRERRCNRKTVRLTREIAETMIDHRTPEREAIENEEWGAVNSAVAGASREVDTEVVRLRGVGLTVEAIAERLGCSPHKVRRSVRRVLRLAASRLGMEPNDLVAASKRHRARA